MKTKAFLLLAVFQLFCSSIFSQSNDFLVIHGSVSGEIGIHGIGIEKAGISAYPLAVGAMISTGLPVELNIGVLKPLSFGLQYTPGKFRVVSTLPIGMQVSKYGLNINIHAINKDRFSWVFSFTPGILKMKPVEFDYENNTLSIDLNGNSFNARSNFNVYFSDNAGMMFYLGYAQYKVGLENFSFKVEDKELADELRELLDQEFRLTASGINFGLGVIFRVPVLNKD